MLHIRCNPPVLAPGGRGRRAPRRTYRLAPVLAAALVTAALGCRDDAQSPTSPQEPTAPVLATTLTQTLSFHQISAGSDEHSCGVTTDDRAYCWGDNGSGQLGVGFISSQLAPVAVLGGLSFRQVSAGEGHTCGVTTSNIAYCWGNDVVGQVGDGAGHNSGTPVPVAGGLRFRQVHAGENHTCGVTTDNVAYCWGANYFGALGDGTTTERSTPVAVAGGLSFRQVVAGRAYSCGTTTDDRAYCWGDNTEGQLGIGSFGRLNGRLTPAPVAGRHSFRQVIAGAINTCGITPDDRAYCWGDNASGEIGDGTSNRRTRPVAVLGGLQFRWVDPGGSQLGTPAPHTCGTTTGHRAYCWGYNHDGELGDGTIINRSKPVAVAGGLQFNDVSAGRAHSCGVTTGSVAYCWGWNGEGELGDGTTQSRLRPRRVAGVM